MHRSRGFTLIELMIVVAIIAIIAALAIPSLLAARKSANETSAIGFLKMSIGINVQYRTRYGAYPRNETDLFNANMVDPSQSPSGYNLNYNTSTSTWSLQANPDTPGTSGDRYFFADESGVIRFDLAAPATTVSEPLGQK